MTSLSDRGYGIPKDALSLARLEELREALTVTPFVPKDFAAVVKPKPFQVFSESERKIYVPKCYGLDAFGLPSRVYIPEGAPIEVAFEGALRPEQVEPVERFLEACADPARMGGILSLPCAFGKCLGKNTPVLRHDGRVVKVQHVRPGDLLMGDDSTPRRVLSTCAGSDPLFNVVQEYGDAYLANGAHLLSLACVEDCDGSPFRRGHLYDLPIAEYVALPERQQDQLAGYKRRAVFARIEKADDPYELAYRACLGFGGFSGSSLTNPFAPDEPSAMEAALQGAIAALAGKEKDPLILEHPDARMVQGICFAARALGYNARLLSFTRACVQRARKNSFLTQDGTEILLSRVRVVPLYVGSYFGFELDGNGRFMLGDFTVTHNTTIAVYAMCRLATKTLVVVHKEFLLEQWKERIAQFAPSARIGTLRGKVVDVEGKDVVISLLQSLSMKDYPPELFREFGFVVVDECHHTAAEVFSRALRKIAFRYTLGLSATPKRKDGLTRVFVWHLGGVVFAIQRRSDILDVRMHDYYDPDPAYSKEETMRFGGHNKLNVTRMINNICEHLPRTRVVCDLVCDVLDEEPERKILVLSERRAHLAVLRDMFEAKGIACGMYMGGMPQSELKASEAMPVILGTFHISHEGLDIRGLDTLVLASPKSDVVQASGRILRDKPEERKHTPLIVDIVDCFSVFHGYAKKRAAYYRSCEYAIQGGGGVSSSAAAGFAAPTSSSAAAATRGYAFLD
jgi:superfamily II DNA or RNA helicase